MDYPFVNIHTHRPAGCGVELRAEGVHPWEAACYDEASLRARLEGVQALGEIGMDALRGPGEEVQRAVFEAQLALARELGLPVVLHCVRRFEPMMRLLAAYRLRAVIFHGFTGSAEQALQAVRRGYCLSFGERSLLSRRGTEALRRIPSEALFLETDESEVAIGTIYERAAALREMPVDALREVVWKNYESIFG